MSAFIPAGHKLTKDIELDAIPESSKYEALIFGLDNKNVFYRKGNVTPDRPGAFLAVWQRPASPSINENKPIPLTGDDLDYLFVQVQEHTSLTGSDEALSNPKSGLFIFPVSELIKRGIVSCATKKGKTGFRVFPPWSQDRGWQVQRSFQSLVKKLNVGNYPIL